MLKSLLLGAFCVVNFTLFSQSDSTQSFKIGIEFRPRFEYRNGYKSLPADSLKAASFISQRSRILLDYSQNKYSLHFSFQDIRTWGENALSPATGSIGVFESYAFFPIKEKWGVKLGRQSVELDNGRLFSKANWNQASKAHDGILLNYSAKKLTNDIMFFYNQTGMKNFGTSYTLPTYKFLVVQYGEYAPNQKWKFKLLNTVDGYQSVSNENDIYARATSGGRIEYNVENWQATVAAYYQFGQLSNGQQVSAFYVQPEIGYTRNNFNAQLGMEYLSGDNSEQPSNISNSFSTLYGVAFKFMGHLDYFTSFPNDTRGGGLINPYLFFEYKFSEKWRGKIESHAFLLQNNTYASDSTLINPFLGIECDLVVKYNISKELFFDFGLSAMSATKSMGEIKSGDFTKIPLYSYLMLTWKPTLFNAGTRRRKH